MEALRTDEPIYIVCAFVVVPFPAASVMGAPVTAKVARSVIELPVEKELKAIEGALMRNSLWSAVAPFA